MRVLILDDEEVRHQAFRQRYPEAIIVSTYRYTDCEDELINGVWDIIHLDHDLGDRGDTYKDGWEKEQFFDGMHIVDAIAFGGVSFKKIIVHSQNNVEAPKMVQTLKRLQERAIRLEGESLLAEITWEPFTVC